MKKPIENIYLLIFLVSFKQSALSNSVIIPSVKNNFAYNFNNTTPVVLNHDQRENFSQIQKKNKIQLRDPDQNKLNSQKNSDVDNKNLNIEQKNFKIESLSQKDNNIISPVLKNEFNKKEIKLNTNARGNIIKETILNKDKDDLGNTKTNQTPLIVKKNNIENYLTSNKNNKLNETIKIDESIQSETNNTIINKPIIENQENIKKNEIENKNKNILKQNNIDDLPLNQTIIYKEEDGSIIKDFKSQIEDLNLNNKIQKDKIQIKNDNLLKTEIKADKKIEEVSLMNNKNINLDESIKNEKIDTKKLNSQIIRDSEDNFGFDVDRLVSYVINIFLIITGCYITFFGFKLFRVLMSILGFYVSYYLILFFLTELDIYNSKLVEHQLGLFFSCIILGFFISILCYMIHQLNFLIFGISIGSMISLMSAQFFIDFKSDEDKIILLVIYLVTSIIFSIIAFFIIHDAVILGSSFIGSIVGPINLGVILQDFKSFEDREKLPNDCWEDFIKYLIILGAMFSFGSMTQYYLKRRLVKTFEDSEIEEIGHTSNLN